MRLFLVILICPIMLRSGCRSQIKSLHPSGLINHLAA